jgi:hypothetical protein
MSIDPLQKYSMSKGALRATVVSALFLVISTTAANAYVGPGSGLSAIGSILGVFTALFLALVGFVWYPIKRLLKHMKAFAKTPTETESAARHGEEE